MRQCQAEMSKDPVNGHVSYNAYFNAFLVDSLQVRKKDIFCGEKANKEKYGI